MTGILSSISGQFGKAFMLGVFLPAALFVIAFGLFVGPMSDISWLAIDFSMLDNGWQLLVVTLIVTLCSALLYFLNTVLIRFYEGYVWCDWWKVGPWRTNIYRAWFNELDSRWKGYAALVFVLDEEDPQRDQINDAWNEITETLRSELPSRSDLILPTRLGNVIRSFEVYSLDRYGMDSIILWPRLIAKIPSEYATTIDDTKTSFNFMLNCSVLSGLLALLALLFGLRYVLPVTDVWLWFSWMVRVFTFSILVYLFYKAAISRARSWGSTVKGAFDMYRWDLLGQLGYQQSATSWHGERDLWNGINQELKLGDRPDAPWVHYPKPVAQPLTSTYPAKARSGLIITKGVRAVSDDGALTVVLRIHNADAAASGDVMVVDTLPNGYQFSWGSASVAGQPIEVMGMNPYEFTVHNIGPGSSVDITYMAVFMGTDSHW